MEGAAADVGADVSLDKIEAAAAVNSNYFKQLDGMDGVVKPNPKPF